MRRLDSASAVPVPRLRVPKTAKKRRRRNRARARLPLNAIKRVVFSSRWLSLGLLALTIYALTLIGLDPRFYLTTIPVEGVVSIPAAEVVQASSLAGTHIFAADPGEAATKIKEVPGVISATVTLRWPNEVSVQVREDTPIAVWIEGSSQYWVTRNGRLIPARSESLGLLFIQSEQTVEEVAAETAVSSSETETEDADVAVAATPGANVDFVPQDVLAGALQLRELRPNIDKLYYRPGSGLSYQDGRGWRVYFGTGTDMQQKLVVYEAIVEELLAQGLTPVYVSVSNQEKPYYLAQ